MFYDFRLGRGDFYFIYCCYYFLTTIKMYSSASSAILTHFSCHIGLENRADRLYLPLNLEQGNADFH